MASPSQPIKKKKKKHQDPTFWVRGWSLDVPWIANPSGMRDVQVGPGLRICSHNVNCGTHTAGTAVESEANASPKNKSVYAGSTLYEQLLVSRPSFMGRVSRVHREIWVCLQIECLPSAALAGACLSCECDKARGTSASLALLRSLSGGALRYAKPVGPRVKQLHTSMGAQHPGRTAGLVVSMCETGHSDHATRACTPAHGCPLPGTAPSPQWKHALKAILFAHWPVVSSQSGLSVHHPRARKLESLLSTNIE